MNLSDAFRYHRARPMPANPYLNFDPRGRHAAEALARARADVLAYRNAAARLEDSAVARDHAAAGPDKAAAESVYRAALAAVAKARRYPPHVQPSGLPWPAFGAAVADDNPRRGRLIRCALADDVPGFRYIGAAETEGGGAWDSRDSGGWYCDPDGHGMLCRGVVYQLPGRDGKARFVAGYAFKEECGGPALDLGHVFTEDMRGAWGCDQDPRNTDAARDAAAHADALAKEAAEEEREYQTAWRAGSNWSDMREEEARTRGELRAALAQFKEARRALAAGQPMPGNPDGATLADKFGRLCALIRSDVADMLESIRESRDKRRTLAEGDDSRLMFWNGDKRLRAAFCEGAGLDQFPA